MSGCCGGDVSGCCKGDGSCQKKNFWGWWEEKEKTFTPDQVKDLLARVKEFNAGAIDEYLTNHVEKVFNEWAAEVDK